MNKYLVCGCTPWARRIFDTRLSKLPGEWLYVSSPEALTATWLNGATYGFFLHWRWKVPKWITWTNKCIGFHLGKLPEERGGSPLQWRILDGRAIATLTMFRLTDDIDGGPVLHEGTVNLDGSAEAVYSRCMAHAAAIIQDFIAYPQSYTARPQEGSAQTAPRRTPEESRLPDIPDLLDLGHVYNRIRCVDAEGYPYAFLDYGGFRFTFRRAVMYDGRIEADVTITETPHA